MRGSYRPMDYWGRLGPTGVGRLFKDTGGLLPSSSCGPLCSFCLGVPTADAIRTTVAVWETKRVQKAGLESGRLWRLIVQLTLYSNHCLKSSEFQGSKRIGNIYFRAQGIQIGPTLGCLEP